MNPINIDYLRQCFREEDGKLTWLQRPRTHFNSDGVFNMWNTTHAGREAGYTYKDKYGSRCIVGLNGVLMKRSRIVWALHTGAWPTADIDHEDRDSLNDRVKNLRLATDSQNLANARKRNDNKSGFKGVSWDKKAQRWRAAICVNQLQIHLGYFDTAEEGNAAYIKAAVQHFGQFAHGG